MVAIQSWTIRYRVATDTHSRIVNDPTGWFEAPLDLVSAFKRIVYLAVETVRIDASLPERFAEPIRSSAVTAGIRLIVEQGEPDMVEPDSGDVAPRDVHRVSYDLSA